jgi:Ion transport protein.
MSTASHPKRLDSFANCCENLQHYLFLVRLLLQDTSITMSLQVFRLLRSLRPLRVINRAPGLKLVVQTLLSSLRPIGNIVLICCTFFIIFGILGVQVKLAYALTVLEVFIGLFPTTTVHIHS